ncbi:MAG: hypothetical protein QNI99_15705, partial [Woeseiaceae bacterium]|nr:hypothetical protein [Woeseiaceae bacterium]
MSGRLYARTTWSRWSRLLFGALAALLTAGCPNSSGPTGESDDPDGPGIGLTTYARSFGGPSFDSLEDMEVDENGVVWLLGTFDGLPWVASLDAAGALIFETSPIPPTLARQAEPRVTRFAGDGGAVFVGHTDSASEGKNVIVQRQSSDGTVLWAVEIDTGDWDPLLNLDYIASRPYAHDIPYMVLGDQDSGWFILGDSLADLTGVKPDGEFTARQTTRSAFVAHVSDAGVVTFVRRFAQTGDDPRNEPDARGARLVTATLYRSGGNTWLAMLVSIDPYRGPRFQRIYEQTEPDTKIQRLFSVSTTGEVVREGTFEATVNRDGVAKPWTPFGTEEREEDGELPIREARQETIIPAFASTRIDGGFAYESQSEIVKLDANGEEVWRFDPDDAEGFDAENFPRNVYALAQTINQGTGNTLLWAGGSNNDSQPTLAALDTEGELVQTCNLASAFPDHVRIIAMEATGDSSSNGLRLLLAERPGGAAVEARIESDCDVVNGSVVQFPQSGLFGATIGESGAVTARWITGTGLAARVLANEGKNTVVAYHSGSGAVLRDLRRENTTQYEGAPFSSSLALGRSSGGARIGTVVSGGGFFRSLDETGTVTRAVLVDRFLTTIAIDFSPVYSAQGTSYLRGRESDDVTTIVRNLASGEFDRLEFPSCFWIDREESGVGADQCGYNPEFLALAPAINGGVDVLGRGRSNDGTIITSFMLNLQNDGPAELTTFISPSLEPPEDFEAGPDAARYNAIDSIRTDGGTVYLVRTWSTLTFYGPTPETSWAIGDWSGLVQSAVLAHDGGVVLLLDYDAGFFGGESDGDIALMKLTEEGEVQWLRVYGTGDRERARIIRRSPRGYVAAAESLGVDAVTPLTKDIWILQVGIDGRIAGDADGVEFCQAGLNSLDGSELAVGAERAFEFDFSVQPLGPTSVIDYGVTPNEYLVQAISSDQSELRSQNTARQCSGVASNNQEDPFRVAQPRTVNVAVSGEGTVTSEPGGIDCGSICSAEFGPGVIVTLRADEASGWSFAGWSGDADCTDGVIEGDAAAVSCTATFTEDAPELGALLISISPNDPALSNGVTSNPRGIACPDICAAEFPVGEMVTLTPVADTPSGWEFDGWTGDANCNEGNVMIVGGPLGTSCTANFVQRTDTSTLTVIVNN